MSAQHTPGPWRIHRASLGDFYMVAPDGGGLPATEANARLIAAAPDLLAALEHIANEPIGDSEASFREVHDAIVGIARAALLKAREG